MKTLYVLSNLYLCLSLNFPMTERCKLCINKTCALNFTAERFKIMFNFNFGLFFGLKLRFLSLSCHKFNNSNLTKSTSDHVSLQKST